MECKTTQVALSIKPEAHLSLLRRWVVHTKNIMKRNNITYRLRRSYSRLSETERSLLRV